MKRKYQILVLSVPMVGFAYTAALAEHAVTTWTSYLYEGPSHHFSVLDEVPQATTIDVASCNGAWCKVSLGGRVGYLPAEVVAKRDPARPDGSLLPQPAAALDPHPRPGPCVKANQTGGNGGNAMTRFCLNGER